MNKSRLTYPHLPLCRTDLKLLEEELRINTIAPIALLRVFLPLLEKGVGKKALFVSSAVGSIEIAVQVPMLCE